jgi:hypothetical protein
MTYLLHALGCVCHVALLFLQQSNSDFLTLTCLLRSGKVSTETGGKVSTETGGKVSAETGGKVSAETGGKVSTETGGKVSTEIYIVSGKNDFFRSLELPFWLWKSLRYIVRPLEAPLQLIF